MDDSLHFHAQSFYPTYLVVRTFIRCKVLHEILNPYVLSIPILP